MQDDVFLFEIIALSLEPGFILMLQFNISNISKRDEKDATHR
jgi:hypothetical protein